MFDVNYKEALAYSLKISDLSLLDSIVGSDELKFLLSKLDARCFTPENYKDKSKIDTMDFLNIKNPKFFANLHVHTNASDGLANIEQILEAALKIADDNAQKQNFGFLLAITDHDTVKNAQKALQIVTKKEINTNT